MSPTPRDAGISYWFADFATFAGGEIVELKRVPPGRYAVVLEADESLDKQTAFNQVLIFCLWNGKTITIMPHFLKVVG